MNATTYQEIVRWKGVPICVDAVRAEDKAFIISGRFIKTAALRNEWQEDVKDPETVIRELKACPAGLDLLRFWQRIPESDPKYNYYHEWLDVAAIPITDYRTWWERLVNSNTRPCCVRRSSI